VNQDKPTYGELEARLAEAEQVIAALRGGDVEDAHRDRDRQFADPLAVVADMTEHKQAEEALRASEKKFRDLTETTPDLIWEVDTEGLYTYVSPKVKDLLGYEVNEVLGTSAFDLMTPEEAKKIRQSYGGAVAREEPFYGLLNTMLHKDGHPVILESNGVPVFDEAGRLRGYRGVDRDVSERKQAEEALRTAEREKAAILDGVPEAMLYHNRELGIIWANRAAGASVGLAADQLAGRRCHEVWQGRDEPCEDCPVLEALETGEAQQRETSSPDGKTWSVRAYPVRDEHGNVTGAVEVAGDITERRQLEGQLRRSQKMEAVGQLAGGIAHDFNNLLQAILGYAEILKLQAEPRSQQYEDLRTIEQAAERAAQLTGQLLGFARKGEYQVIPVNMHEIICGLIQVLERTVDKNIRITADFAAAAATIQGDPTQLEQVLMNLALNARDAMPDGGQLVIRTATVERDETYCNVHKDVRPGTYLVVTVSDTGCGMSKEVQGRAFEPFFTTKEMGRGTGMGLAMVYGTVTSHGGAIEVDSEEGRGTALRVYLPVAARAAAEGGAAGPGESLRGAGHVLVVDDEDAVRQVATKMLSNLGYTVHAVRGGKQAVEYYREHHNEIALVIIDLIMPEMDGRETFRALKEVDPEVKAILCSGYDRNERVQVVIDEGVLGFVQKPHRRQELSEAIARALNG